MSDTMFTQLTISVQGRKTSGKTTFADRFLAPLILAAGGSIVQKRDDKTGVYVTCTLPLGALAAPFEKDTAAPIADGLRALGAALHLEIGDLLARRSTALRALSEREGPLMASAPSFVPAPALLALVRENATAELQLVDEQFALLGFRYEAGK